MKRKFVVSRSVRLSFSLVAGVLLLLALFGLAAIVPGYDTVRQTASEIGEMDSPARWPFTSALVAVGISLLVFASGIRAVAGGRKHGYLAAFLVGSMAVSVAGVGWFAFPHALHNTFGLSQLLGYLAPLAFAIAWRGDTISRVSWSAAALLLLSVLVNLGYMGVLGEQLRAQLQPGLQPVYGLVQRSLFLIWFGWCVMVGLILLRRERGTADAPAPLSGRESNRWREGEKS
jgi:hypothetical protein